MFTDRDKASRRLACLLEHLRGPDLVALYQRFPWVSDDEALVCLAGLPTPPAVPVATGSAAGPVGRDEDVAVRVDAVVLPGRLTVPEGACGLVLFAHGSGSGRGSPRNSYMAEALHAGGLGTLLFDLLTPDEQRDRSKTFDIDLLGHRLVVATAWLKTQPGLAGLPIGYVGASTGAAAALWAAAELGTDVAAVVSRGGRPDMADTRLSSVRAPTLLIVGGEDELVVSLNRRAIRMLRCETRMAIVPNATHLFEEPGALAAAAGLARAWLCRHLPRRPPRDLLVGGPGVPEALATAPAVLAGESLDEPARHGGPARPT